MEMSITISDSEVSAAVSRCLPECSLQSQVSVVGTDGTALFSVGTASVLTPGSAAVQMGFILSSMCTVVLVHVCPIRVGAVFWGNENRIAVQPRALILGLKWRE